MRVLKNAGAGRDVTWERIGALAHVAERGPLSISELCELERVTQPTMSRMISALQARALVRCAGHQHDRRSVMVACTLKGRTALDRAFRDALEVLVHGLAELDQRELRVLADLIRGTFRNRVAKLR